MKCLHAGCLKRAHLNKSARPSGWTSSHLNPILIKSIVPSVSSQHFPFDGVKQGGQREPSQSACAGRGIFSNLTLCCSRNFARVVRAPCFLSLSLAGHSATCKKSPKLTGNCSILYETPRAVRPNDSYVSNKRHNLTVKDMMCCTVYTAL